MSPSPRKIVISSSLLLAALIAGGYLMHDELPAPSGQAAIPPSQASSPAPEKAEIRVAAAAAPEAAAAAPPAASFVAEDRGSPRRFEIALDEAVRRNVEGKDLTVRLDPPATLETLSSRLRQLPGEVLPVCYEPGKPHIERYRRIITRDITIQLPSAEAEPVLPAGVTLKERPEYAPGFAVVSAPDPFAALAALEPLRATPQVVTADIQLASQRQLRTMPNDPLVAQQWHLKFQNQSGALSGTDVNIENAWLYGGSGGVRGSGVRIGIVDDGLQTGHPDLSANVDTVNDKDWNGNDSDPSPGTGDDHGTSCAGNAAAIGNNNLGVSGTAPEATLVGMRLIAAATTDSQEAEAMAYLPALIAIKSNSWGPNDDGATLEAPGSLTRAALANATATGRGGLGTLFLWAGGNGLAEKDNSNYDGYANDIHTIAIAASDSRRGQADYSESGANIVVAAPSSGDFLGITTVDRTGTAGYNTANSASGGDYTDDFGGTSSATPTAAGITALLLQKNPNLGWRDVKEILIRSAFKLSPTDVDWVDNSAGLHFNHKFGAGLIDATAAVNLAGAWINLPAATSQNVAQTGLSVAIPDNNTTGITRSFAFSGVNLRMEHATVTLSVSHANRGELEVTLTSPSGMSSRLAELHDDNASDYSSWTFSSVRHWGENSAGTWTLKVADRKSGTTGTLTSATLTLHGTANAPINPGPVAQITSPADAAVFSPGATVNVIVTASDLNADGSPGTVASVQLLDNGTPVSTDSSAPFEFNLSSPALGSHSLTAIATDGQGEATTSGAVTFSVVNQPPVITAAGLSPAGQGYADEVVSIAGLTASDPENQSLSFSYLWEKSADSVTWVSSGVTSATLPPAEANAAFLWRCQITASDGMSSSPPFTTGSVNLLLRPPLSAAIGTPFSYDSGLVLRGTDSPVSRNAIVNEFSQGAAGTSEWVEILTLREASFRNWKLADSTVNQITFADSAVWDAIPAGTLIVIYNGAAKDSLLPADDADFSDRKVVLASNNATYFTGSWPAYGNSGDAVILKDAAGANVAGFSYGTSSAINPHFGSLGSGDAAYYAGSSDADASSSDSWTITSSQVARQLRAVGDLFISEYVEGSSNNKVIELFNPNTTAVNLATDAYKIEVYANGAVTPASSITLTGSVAAGGTFVLKHGSANASITAQQVSGSLTFNGNDAVVLRKGTAVADVIGQVGNNPGTAWSGGGVSTVDKTLRRKASVRTGDSNQSDAFDPSLEWEQFNTDDFTGLGSHTIDSGGGGDPTITLGVSPASFPESAGASAATGTVTLSVAAPANVVVTLLSSDGTAATVPVSVTVLSGQTTANFAIAAVNDSEPDGAQTSVISATAGGYTGANFIVTVNDDEPSLEGVTPINGNTPVNTAFIAELRSGVLTAPALFRFGSSAVVPAGLSIDPATGVVSGTPGGTAGNYNMVIERYNTLGEVVSQSFTLELGGSGYAAWIGGYPGLSSTVPDGDPDQDGLVNLLEYHLGANPGVPDAVTSLPVLGKSASTVTLTWWRLKSATDTTGVAQWSETLAPNDWQSTGFSTQVIADEPTREQVRATLPVAELGKQMFLRLRVE